jgi:isocitrate dehydrogenase
MFEAIHGSAPRRAHQNLANPSGLLLGAVLMLVHINQPDAAARVHNAWLRTIEDGVHTYDIFTEGSSKEKVGTREFAHAVVARLGQKPNTLKPVSYAAAPAHAEAARQSAAQPDPKVDLIGVDVYVNWPSLDNNTLAGLLQKTAAEGLSLTMMSNRGVKTWPHGHPETFCTDNFRCRFAAGGVVTQGQIVGLLGRIADTGVEIVKTENLRNYDGKPGYTLAQGE